MAADSAAICHYTGTANRVGGDEPYKIEVYFKGDKINSEDCILLQNINYGHYFLIKIFTLKT